MNKKFLFAALSIAALTACSTDDFESQKIAEGTTSPIQFEVINNDLNDLTRASMDGNSIVWNANDGDLFTLYHGATLGAVKGYENATYQANAKEGGTATLSTPSMIKQGGAIMVWPVDTTFRIKAADNLSLTIPAVQTNIENNIPYVSDLVSIGAYGFNKKGQPLANSEGYNRKYPVFMRPMASQLTIKADYAGTDKTIATLEAGDDGIDPIKVTSVDLSTSAENFTTDIELAFSGATGANWGSVKGHAWNQVTEFGAVVTNSAMLTAKDKCVTGNDSCKFLLLPQATISGGVKDGAVVVNTIYGSVVVAANGVTISSVPNPMASEYSATEIKDAWYRYISKSTTPATGETKATKETTGLGYKTTANTAFGMQQTINAFSTATASSGVAKGEPVGAVSTRYLKVLLTHLNMSNLHIKSDKQLRDAARVWQKLGLTDVTVYLDGDKNKEFKISQQTIKTINDINAKLTTKSFKVKPCVVTGEKCDAIVITGGGNIPDLRFIKQNEDGTKANVAFNAGETWNWNNVVYVDATDVATITNRGDMVNAATATLTMNNGAAQVLTIPFKNEGTWTISGGDLNVQFDVTNIGTVEIASGAEYHQDGTGNDFTNDTETLEDRFLAAGKTEKIGLINNHGVFATVKGGNINNYGLIEHLEMSAKTYVTTNTAGVFNAAFNKNTNKIGRINLPYSNRNEENLSISNGAATGFVSVTVSPGQGAATDLDLSKVGDYVNYCIIKGGVETIKTVSAKIKYVEFDAGTDEIMWTVAAASYDGLIVFSPVNVKRGTTVNINAGGSVYLKAKMYVGGTTNIASSTCTGYYGNTKANFDTMYITY